jgi:TatD DNase family protein
MLIDTHCHLTFEELAGQIEDVLFRSRQAGVSKWVTIGTQEDENLKAVELAERFDGMYAAVGIHPHYAKDVTDEGIEALKRIAKSHKVVAIGETGLDFHYNFSKQDAQKKIFVEHLKIAGELELPVVVHTRQAFDETMEILDGFAGELKNVVIHCFSGDQRQAQIVLDKGYYISFTGVVTFKNADIARQAAKLVPLERLMIETDCPYMSPAPMRNQKINEPGLLVHTARFLAELKEIEFEDFAKAVTETSERFFGI